MLRYSRRDQLSVNLAIQRASLIPKILEIDNNASCLHTWPHIDGRDRDRGPRRSAAVFNMPIAIARETERQRIEALITERNARQDENAALEAEIEAQRTETETRITEETEKQIMLRRQFEQAAASNADLAAERDALRRELNTLTTLPDETDGTAEGSAVQIEVRRLNKANFDAGWYLSNNPDVAVSGMDPTLHYVLYGRKEGRRASFSNSRPRGDRHPRRRPSGDSPGFFSLAPFPKQFVATHLE